MAKKKKSGSQRKRNSGSGALTGMRSGMQRAAGGKSKKSGKKEASFGQVFAVVLGVFAVAGLIALLIR